MSSQRFVSSDPGQAIRPRPPAVSNLLVIRCQAICIGGEMFDRGEGCSQTEKFRSLYKMSCHSTSIDHPNQPPLPFSFITTTNGLICLLPDYQHGQDNWSGPWRAARVTHCWRPKVGQGWSALFIGTTHWHNSVMSNFVIFISALTSS